MDKATPLVEAICSTLVENYVYPDASASMVARLHERLASGSYDSLEDATLAQKITQDLQAVCNDAHVVLRYDPYEAKSIHDSQTGSPDPSARAKALELGRRDNFFFAKVEILEANIGLLKLNGFSGLPEAMDTAVAAMNFLSNTEALIVDLRRNRGGDTVMNQLLVSYLFRFRPRQITGIYWRPSDAVLQTWTSPHVPGRRLGGIPVYVVTSGRTFSAAEDFAHTLKHMKRATIIGEWTGGGAHPGQNMVVGGQYVLNVPMGRPMSPPEWGVDADWEGTGVEPDIEVPAVEALTRARREAITHLDEHTEDDLKHRWYAWALAALEPPAEIDTQLTDAMVGDYGRHRVRLEEGRLYFDWFGLDAAEMIYSEPGVFRLDGIKDYRVEPKWQDGKVTAIQEHYFDGRGLNLHPRSS